MNNENDIDNCRLDSVYWQVLADSVIGANHEKSGQLCQDSHYWKILKRHILIASVADGAGSAEMGDIGARISAQTAVEKAYILCSKFSNFNEISDEDLKLLLISAFESAIKEIKVYAKLSGISIRDLASTLILLIATPKVISSAQVGDGASITCNKEGNLVSLTTPKVNEYINETTFLVLPDALDNIQIGIYRNNIKHVAIISDGLQMLAFKMPEGTPHIPFFLPLFNFISSIKNEESALDQLSSFLKSSRVRERTDDDLTLFLATLKE